MPSQTDLQNPESNSPDAEATFLQFLENGGIELDGLTGDTKLNKIEGRITDKKEGTSVYIIFRCLQEQGYDRIDDLVSCDISVEIKGIGPVLKPKLAAIKALFIQEGILQVEAPTSIEELRALYEKTIDWTAFSLQSKLSTDVQIIPKTWSDLARKAGIITLKDLATSMVYVRDYKWIGPASFQAIQVLIDMCTKKGIITPEAYKTGLLGSPLTDLEA